MTESKCYHRINNNVKNTFKSIPVFGQSLRTQFELSRCFRKECEVHAVHISVA